MRHNHLAFKLEVHICLCGSGNSKNQGSQILQSLAFNKQDRRMKKAVSLSNEVFTLVEKVQVRANSYFQLTV